jgi:thymidylate synthase
VTNEEIDELYNTVEIGTQIEIQLAREPKPLPKMILNPNIKDIFAFGYDDFTLVGYEPHPAIKGQVAI